MNLKMVLEVYLKALNNKTHPNYYEIARINTMIKDISQTNMSNISMSRETADQMLTAVKIFQNKMDGQEAGGKKLPSFKTDHIWHKSMDKPNNPVDLKQKRHNINSFAVFVANSNGNGNGIQPIPSEWKIQIPDLLKDISLKNQLNIITNNNDNDDNNNAAAMNIHQQTTTAPICYVCGEPFLSSKEFDAHLMTHQVCICFIYLYIYIFIASV